MRALKAGDRARALAILERMVLIAPARADLWIELAASARTQLARSAPPNRPMKPVLHWPSRAPACTTKPRWRWLVSSAGSTIEFVTRSFPRMTLTVAIQMDPIDKIDIAGDSTFALALEAQARGHSCSITARAI